MYSINHIPEFKSVVRKIFVKYDCYQVYLKIQILAYMFVEIICCARNSYYYDTYITFIVSILQYCVLT